MKPYAALLVLGALALAGCRPAVPARPASRPTPAEPINDAALLKRLQATAQKLIQGGKIAPTATLRQQLSRKQCELILPELSQRKMTPGEIYRAHRESVLVVAGVFKCKRCPRWHTTGASGFLITPSGVFVTNYHVLNNQTNHTFVGMTSDGAIYPVKEVLAASEVDDVAIGQLDAPGVKFKPVALSTDAPVGAPVTVISHPDKQLYTLTRGVVSRYFRRTRKGKKATVMAITADFARGSSGGPVFNESGAVVGFVGSTRSVYYKVVKGKKENLQMVFKHCVPTASILKLIKAQ